MKNIAEMSMKVNNIVRMPKKRHNHKIEVVLSRKRAQTNMPSFGVFFLFHFMVHIRIHVKRPHDMEIETLSMVFQAKLSTNSIGRLHKCESAHTYIAVAKDAKIPNRFIAIDH